MHTVARNDVIILTGAISVNSFATLSRNTPRGVPKDCSDRLPFDVQSLYSSDTHGGQRRTSRWIGLTYGKNEGLVGDRLGYQGSTWDQR